MQKNMMQIKITKMEKCIYDILRSFLRGERSFRTYLTGS